MIGFENRNPAFKSSLGKERNLVQEEKENLLGLEFKSVKEYKELDLTAGIANKELNRKVLHLILPKLIQDREEYIKQLTPRDENFYIRAEELIPTAPGENLVLIGYLPDIRLLEHIRDSKPALFDALLKASFQGDIETINRFLEKNYGKQIRNKFKDINVPTRELLQEISGQK